MTSDPVLRMTSDPCPQDDMFAVELLAGHIYVHVDLGSGSARVRATDRRVDDGLWHSITVVRQGRKGRVTVDDHSSDFVTPGGSRESGKAMMNRGSGMAGESRWKHDIISIKLSE